LAGLFTFIYVFFFYGNIFDLRFFHLRPFVQKHNYSAKQRHVTFSVRCDI